MSLALVTGVGPGPNIGAAVAARLASDGFRVVAHSLEDSDLSAPGAVEALVAEPVDALVACHAADSAASLGSLTAAEIDHVYAVNVRSVLLLVQAMAAFGRPGRVVYFTSGQWNGAMPGELPYVASKGALRELTASLAIALAAQGITVNCIDPGPTDTGYASPELRDAVAAASPRGRWGSPEDAARLVSWLVSAEADWVTGQVIASDGGWSSRPRA